VACAAALRVRLDLAWALMVEATAVYPAAGMLPLKDRAAWRIGAAQAGELAHAR
jgi:hypothetical protein